MIDTYTIMELKTAMLRAQTLDQLHALIINYTHEEMIQTYKELAPEQQAQIKAIYERDSEPILQAFKIPVAYP